MDRDFNIIRPLGLKPKPDIQVIRTGEYWEIKNLRGNGKHTVEDNLRKASSMPIKPVLLIEKAGKVVDIK